MLDTVVLWKVKAHACTQLIDPFNKADKITDLLIVVTSLLYLF